MTIIKSKAWSALKSHKKELQASSLISMFEDNPGRFEQFSLEAAGIFLDYSKNLITPKTLQLLFDLAEKSQLKDRIEALLRGDTVNNTERRQALHTALRASTSSTSEYAQTVAEVLAKMTSFVEAVHSGRIAGHTCAKFTDVVNIGIGGSDLGPMVVTEALTPYHIEGIKTHFVSNVDASDICSTLKHLNPATTLFIVASKTFTTQETLTNADTARSWLLNWSGDQTATEKHFIAVSANVDKAVEFGIAEKNIFPIWDWVGGRYSLWSAIGIPIALAVGMDGFKRLLKGASAMDNHFATAPLMQNMPVLLGLMGVWYVNFWDADTHAVLPYDHYLRFFAKYLQQLDMESNGKSVNREGGDVGLNTGPIIWGGAGTNGQHSFHELLHQGTRLVPADFIAILTSHNPKGQHHGLLFANCLAQSRALMCGKSLQQAEDEISKMGYTDEEARELAPHKAMPGNRPSNTLIVEQVTPETLGALIALYEHKVYVQSVIWNINAYDQWGVELGKQLCSQIYDAMSNNGCGGDLDSSTTGLIKRYQCATTKPI